MDDKAIDVELAIWDLAQPPWERADPIWSLPAYRLSRYALDVVRADLGADTGIIGPGTRDQLLRVVASISANISEGYSRPTVRERGRFYTFALGSTREAISWYASLDDRLPPGTAVARVAVLSRIRRLLLGLVQRALNARRFPQG